MKEKIITIEETKDRLGFFYNEFCYWMRDKDMPFEGFYQKDLEEYVTSEQVMERLDNLK